MTHIGKEFIKVITRLGNIVLDKHDNKQPSFQVIVQTE